MKQKANEDVLVQRIERAFGRRNTNGLVLPAGDDAALWAPTRGQETILTCDWFLEGTHFLRHKHPADAVGWKCLARAVSDVAAMGGQPRCFLLSMALPVALTGGWLDEFLRGLRRASKTLRCELAGGDTTRGECVLINVTVIGEIARRRAIRRSGATAGDAIYVSGTLGEADLGLRELRQSQGMGSAGDAALRKHFYPEPRLDVGAWLAKTRLATAMMDLSDGLSTDLPRLCAASRVGAKIEVDSLPATTLTDSREARELALHGGDDYELLFTVTRKNVARVPRSFRGVRLTRIGEITQRGKVVMTEGGKAAPLKAGGWDPFRER
jgi:thiamine-monophosphate kinase